MPVSKGQKDTYFNIRVSQGVKSAFQNVANSKSTDMSKMFTEFIEQQINNNKKKLEMKETGVIYKTTDYKLFKTIKGNREVNQLHLKRLVKSIKENYLFTIITVNENYEIIDGQHRYNALKELNLPINYTICKGYGISEIQTFNTNNKKWSTDDYVDGYIDLGKTDYKVFKQFKNRYNLSFAACISLLSNKFSDNGADFIQFKNGDFKVVDLNNANYYAELIISLKSVCKFYNNSSLFLLYFSALGIKILI